MMADTDEVKIGPNATLVLYKDEEGDSVEVYLYKMPSDMEGTYIAMNGELKEYALIKTIIAAAADKLGIEFREESSDA
jgi:hypothetical protein